MSTIQSVRLHHTIALIGLQDRVNPYEAADFRATDQLTIDIEYGGWVHFYFHIGNLKQHYSVPPSSIKSITHIPVDTTPKEEEKPKKKTKLA
jgi:hypothetical protein